MTVYAVNQPKREDLTPAQVFGDLEYVNMYYIYSDQVAGCNGGVPANFTRNMERAADAFNPDHDFVLIVGDHLQLIAFTSMLAVRYAFYNVLRYDREAGGYYPVKINGIAEPTPALGLGQYYYKP